MNALARQPDDLRPARHALAVAPRRAENHGIFCLRGDVLSSNGSDMAVYKARAADGSEGAGPPAPRGSEMSDADICHALAAGEAWAAEVIFDRVEDVVDAVLYRLLGPGDGERDDLAQQALERVIS